MEFSPLITFIAQVVIMVGAILWSKYIVPKLSPRTIEKAREGLELLTSYANKYVAWADNFMPDAKGAAKMASVVDQLRIIANNNKIKTNDQELQAIAQKSFDDMELEWNGAEDEENRLHNLLQVRRARLLNSNLLSTTLWTLSTSPHILSKLLRKLLIWLRLWLVKLWMRLTPVLRLLRLLLLRLSVLRKSLMILL